MMGKMEKGGRVRRGSWGCRKIRRVSQRGLRTKQVLGYREGGDYMEEEEVPAVQTMVKEMLSVA